MANPAWGQLAKAQDDPETIEEAIARIVQQHDDDETSHLETGQALQSHKASDIIDHLAESIIEDKIADGELGSAKMKIAAKVAECVVAASGGDYTSLAAALAAGKKTIYIKNGTYTIPVAGITISSDDIEIWGESREGVVLQLEASEDPDAIILTLSGDRQNIHFYDLTFDANFPNMTGESIDCSNVLASGAIHDITFQNCGFLNAAGRGSIYISNSSSYQIRISECYFDGCEGYGGLDIFASKCIISQNYFTNCDQGLTCIGNYNEITGNIFYQNSFAIYLQGADNCIIGNICVSNDRSGIDVHSGDSNLVIGNKCYLNGSSYNEPGISISSTVRNTSVIGNTCYGNYGAGIQGYISYNTTITGNVCNYNRREGIKLTGCQFSAVSGNTCYRNSQGSAGTYCAILLTTVTTYYCLYNVISNNAIDATNNPYGIREDSANSNYNIFIGNNVRNASTANISTSGANDEVAHNIAP